MGIAILAILGFTCASAAPDWSDVISRANAVFDITCPTMTADELAAKHAAMVLLMPEGNRFMVIGGDIFIPGTDFRNPRDIMVNMDAAPEFDAELGARFHAGAMRRARLLRQKLSGILDPETPVRLTGYSLGGAVAVVLGLYLEADGLKVESVLTFGQFPVTDAAGASKFSGKPVLRIKSGLDGVPDLHSASYSHFGDMLILLDGHMFAHVRQNEVGFVQATRFHGINPFVDHDTYLNRLQGKAGGAAIEMCLSTDLVSPVNNRICPTLRGSSPTRRTRP